jgi:MurNAc alpha-1-phosphate uridylyltransferase
MMPAVEKHSANNSLRLMYPVAILAGGVASRMRPRTDHVPKALLDVAGQPFIAHQLTLLSEQRITDVIICTGHLGEQIEAFVGDGTPWGLRIRFSYDGPQLLGTGGALRRALPLLGGAAFFVMYGDSYLTCDFNSVSRAFLESNRRGLMTVFRNDNTLGDSNVLFDRGQILGYEKISRPPEMRHIDYGLSVLSPAALTPYPPDTPFDLTRVFQDLLAQGQLAGFEVPDRFFEIGSPEGFRDTAALLAQRTRRSR